jgi:hypothetical protein
MGKDRDKMKKEKKIKKIEIIPELEICATCFNWKKLTEEEYTILFGNQPIREEGVCKRTEWSCPKNGNDYCGQWKKWSFVKRV